MEMKRNKKENTIFIFRIKWQQCKHEFIVLEQTYNRTVKFLCCAIFLINSQEVLALKKLFSFYFIVFFARRVTISLRLYLYQNEQNKENK
jgi:hypothetical protein